jgi:hypothetical protein
MTIEADLIRAWHSDRPGRIVAQQFGLKLSALYARWYSLQARELLPDTPRPHRRAARENSRRSPHREAKASASLIEALDPRDQRRLAQAAEQRHTSAAELAVTLLHVIAHDGLVDAVLDDAA